MQNFVGKTKCIVGYMKVADVLLFCFFFCFVLFVLAFLCVCFFFFLLQNFLHNSTFNNFSHIGYKGRTNVELALLLTRDITIN